MREDDKMWERFEHADSFRWGGDPGDQLRVVPAALRKLGDAWLLLAVSLIGRSDVARMKHAVSADEFVLRFDYREGSLTEGTWGFAMQAEGRDNGDPVYGFSRPDEAVEAFLRRV